MTMRPFNKGHFAAPLPGGHHACCSSSHPAPSRRDILLGLGALGAIGAAGPAAAALPKAAKPGKPARIDVHHHLLPPPTAALYKSRNLTFPAWNGWTPEKGIEDMDKAGVSLSMASITTPGIWFGDAQAAATLARQCNDYSARLVADHPGRFGMFAALPMPDIDSSLKEIEYALDTLKADGIQLFTSYGDKWLGDPAFDPVFEELNRRRALVYTHPTAANCCRNTLPNFNPAAIEYGTDTTRAIARMIFTGAAERFSGIRMIFSHAGGTMPFLIERFVFEANVRAKNRAPGFRAVEDLQRFYYDTAQSSNAVAMGALRKVVPVSQIVFGSDFPFRTTAEQVQALREGRVFNARELKAIDADNALRLLPRYNA